VPYNCYKTVTSYFSYVVVSDATTRVRLFGGRKRVHYTEVRTSSELHTLFEHSPTLHDALLESDTAPLPQVPGGINYS